MKKKKKKIKMASELVSAYVTATFWILFVNFSIGILTLGIELKSKLDFEATLAGLLLLLFTDMTAILFVLKRKKIGIPVLAFQTILKIFVFLIYGFVDGMILSQDWILTIFNRKTIVAGNELFFGIWQLFYQIWIVIFALENSKKRRKVLHFDVL